MSDLGSAPVPAVGEDDHVRGAGPEMALYFDLACPHCAAAWGRIRELPLRICVRHFPMASRRPRSPVLHAATEAAARQAGEDAFFAFWDSLLAEQAYQDDPHLWQRAERLGLDLRRFDADRRSDPVAARIRHDFESGIRAGVTGTPAGFVGGQAVKGDLLEALQELAESES